MADESTRPGETPHFETDTVQADRAREQGLGLGERELNAQRDPGGVRTADEDPMLEDGASRTVDEDALDQSIGVQGSADGERRRADDV
ncbi:hypothetical protein [Brevundimonas sp.]|uniref:hypothetical protein n=1 Tax=Brevundimonas sp. TaxID=1871086 RepID=UPI002D6C4FF0|nr:hypothetical protein [Brevundimonas sp.]HYD27600.1 hypothetical protein [Brevundimonas sp.]